MFPATPTLAPAPTELITAPKLQLAVYPAPQPGVESQHGAPRPARDNRLTPLGRRNQRGGGGRGSVVLGLLRDL